MPDTPNIAQLKQRYREVLIQLNQGVSSTVYFDFTRIYPETQSVDELVSQVDDLKHALDSFRPFDPEQVKNLDQYFAERYTYDSNRIEGNTLTFRETTLILDKGVTIAGKSLREHLEVTNHAHAFEYIKDIASGNADLSEQVLRSIHQLILTGIDPKNAGRYRTIDVAIAGSQHQPSPSYLIPQEMDGYFAFYVSQKDNLHPVILAAEIHHRLVAIHPFVDGNGRTARLLMNLILLKHGYPIANISGSADSRSEYYAALEAADLTGSANRLHRLVLSEVKRTAIWYLERISTTEDVTKGAYFFERIAPYLPDPPA